MQYRRLGRTDIQVSVLCLGTMTFGEQNTQKEAHEQCDLAFERGVNFIDTAEMYPVPPNQKTYSKTEQYLGTWPKLKTQREQIILATKAVGPAEMCAHIRDGQIAHDRKNLVAAVDASLKRLQTDYIDLYQLHWPDRATNFFGQRGYEHQPGADGTPLLETLRVLQDLQESGKVRHFGLSNETAWGAMRFIHLAEQYQLPRMVSIQNPYNLLNRSFEVGLAEIAHREDLGLLAYSPLAFGVLSGKYLHGARPAGARLTLWDRFSRYSHPQAQTATLAYCELARKFDLSPAQMALAYVNTRSFVTSNIIGATQLQQLEENLNSLELQLPSELLLEIEKVQQAFPNPAP